MTSKNPSHSLHLQGIILKCLWISQDFRRHLAGIHIVVEDSNHISAKAVAVIKRPKVPRFNLEPFLECLNVDIVLVVREKKDDKSVRKS